MKLSQAHSLGPYFERTHPLPVHSQNYTHVLGEASLVLVRVGPLRTTPLIPSPERGSPNVARLLEGVSPL